MFAITVPSKSDPRKSHTVRRAGDHWVCDCKGHLFNSRGEAYSCVHVAELTASLVSFSAIARHSRPSREALGL
jgi:hypothetical protein